MLVAGIGYVSQDELSLIKTAGKSNELIPNGGI